MTSCRDSAQDYEDTPVTSGHSKEQLAEHFDRDTISSTDVGSVFSRVAELRRAAEVFARSAQVELQVVREFHASPR